MSNLLANCTISFHTNDEDKDDDTHVTVRVFDAENTLSAIISDDFGHFNDHSDNGPYGLVIENPSTRESLQRGNIMIRIDPNGHDTWRFNFTLDLYFSDGSHLGGTVSGIELTQNRQQQTFGMSGFLRSN